MFLSSLSHYEIVAPVRVGPQGTVLPDAPPGRRRRDLGSRWEESQLYYRVSTSGVSLLLNLTLQGHLLSRRFRVEFWRKGGVAWTRPFSPSCQYTGHVMHQDHSSAVALSVCNGLVSS